MPELTADQQAAKEAHDRAAEAQAEADRLQAEADEAGSKPVEVTLDTLDARVSEIERRLDGGAAE